MKNAILLLMFLILGNLVFAAQEKYVGIMYETWFNAVNLDGTHNAPTYPEPVPYPAWRYWGEPALGKYLSTDKSVINRHADLLAAAKVDFIYIDYSNSNINNDKLHYPLKTLLEVYQDRIKKGIATPKITFLMGNAAKQDDKTSQEQEISKLYNEVYKNYDKNIFFYYKGKPLLLPVSKVYTPSMDFFTVKLTWGLMGTGNNGRASIMEHYPQPVVNEVIAVSAAQQETYMSNTVTAHGRKYNYRSGKNNGVEGQNFDDQWSRAIEQNPKFVFLNSWNEWTAQYINSNFTDEFNPEFSHDIEPMKGGFGNFYYNKMKQYIKIYKGADTTVPDTGSNIDIFDSRVFNAAFYMNKYADLNKAFGNNETALKNHWRDNGLKEGRIAHPNFSVVDYLNRYNDLKTAFGSDYFKALEHYLVYGIKEGRNGAPGSSGTTGTNTGNTNLNLPVGKWVTIVAKHSGKAAHVADWSKDNGGKIVQWDNNGTENSQWNLESLGQGYYKITNKSSGKILETAGYSKEKGGVLQQWNYIGHEFQQWKIESAGDGYYKLTNRGNGLVMDVSGVSKENLAVIHQWEYINGDNQKWKFVIKENTTDTGAVTTVVDNKSRIIGYMPSWTGSAESIRYSMLTHINYAFALPKKDGHLKPLENADKLRKIVELAHKNGVKVIISIGGWSDGGTILDGVFEAFAGNATYRTNFVNDAIGLVNTYSLDGVDIDWEYPDPNGVSDKNYTLLIKEIKAKLAKGKTLSAAVLPGSNTANGISNDALKQMDWINIMAYDGDDKAGHSPYSLAVSGLNYWSARGLSKEKINIGVPFYARPSWKGYNELVKKDSNAPYKDTSNGDYYNGINTMKAKATLAKEKAGGIMIWELTQDTTDNTSLLKVIYETLK